MGKELVESTLPPIEIETVPSPVNGEPQGEPKRRGRPPGSKNVANQEKLAGELAQKLIEIALPMALVAPLSYRVLEDRADKFSIALVRRSQRNPRLRSAIDAFIAGSDMVEIIMLPAGMIIGALVDYNRISPESKPARHFNLHEYWIEEYGEPEPSQNGHVIVQPRTGFIQ